MTVSPSPQALPRRNRAYRIRWRLAPLPKGGKNPNYWNYYNPKWNNFIRTVCAQRKLSNSQLKSLPDLRRVLDASRSCMELPGIESRDLSLYNLMKSVYRIFDSSDRSLKAVTLAHFGIDSDTYLRMIGGEHREEHQPESQGEDQAENRGVPDSLRDEPREDASPALGASDPASTPEGQEAPTEGVSPAPEAPLSDGGIDIDDFNRALEQRAAQEREAREEREDASDSSDSPPPGGSSLNLI